MTDCGNNQFNVRSRKDSPVGGPILHLVPCPLAAGHWRHSCRIRHRFYPVWWVSGYTTEKVTKRWMKKQQTLIPVSTKTPASVAAASPSDKDACYRIFVIYIRNWWNKTDLRLILLFSWMFADCAPSLPTCWLVTTTDWCSLAGSKDYEKDVFHWWS